MFSLLLVALTFHCAQGNFLFDDVNAVPHGAQIRLSKTGLQYLADIEVKALKEKLNNFRVPDQQGGEGHFTISAYNIVIKYLRVVSQSIRPIPNVGLTLKVEGIQIPASGTVHARYKKGWIKVSDTTNVEITASGVDFSLDIKIDAKNGKPHAAVTKCNANIRDINLHFHGGLSWLYNLFRRYLAKKLKGVLLEQMCKQGNDLINNRGNKALENFPVRKNIKNFAYIDYSFQQPTFTSEYMDLFLRGEFLDYNHPVKSKLTPPTFDVSSASSKMAYIWLSDYSLNTAGEVFHKAQLLKKVLKVGDKIPPGVKPFLNTRTIKEFIPQLYEKYPERPIEIKLETFNPPKFSIRPGSVNVALFVRAGIHVRTKDNKLVQVFHIDLSVDAVGQANVVSTKNIVNVGGIITSFHFKLNVGGSVIGAVNLPVENESIRNMVRGLVVDQANPILDRGFPIPQSTYLELKNPTLTLVKEAIRIDTMVEYHLHPKE